jgi:hypothetical protein
VIQASKFSRFPRLLLALIVTFLLALLITYLTPTELLLLFLTAIPGGFITHKLPKAIITGLLGVLLAELTAFLILYTTTPNLPTAIQTIPTLFTITLLLPALMGALGGGIGAEVWHLSTKQVQPQEIKQST